MAKHKELVYLVLDELKITTDDSIITEDHVLFLLNKYRGLLLKRDYLNKKKFIPLSNFLTIELEVMQVPAIPNVPWEGGTFLKSKNKIPTILEVGTPKLYTTNFYEGNISYVSKERMKHVGNNKWLQNTIYASLAPDGYLYFKSANALFLHLEKVILEALFLNPSDLIEGDIMEADFPLSDDLLPELIQGVVKELSGILYRPKDSYNNANDDLSDLNYYIRRNMKSDLTKQLEGNA